MRLKYRSWQEGAKQPAFRRSLVYVITAGMGCLFSAETRRIPGCLGGISGGIVGSHRISSCIRQEMHGLPEIVIVRGDSGYVALTVSFAIDFRFLRLAA